VFQQAGATKDEWQPGRGDVNRSMPSAGYITPPRRTLLEASCCHKRANLAKIAAVSWLNPGKVRATSRSSGWAPRGETWYGSLPPLYDTRIVALGSQLNRVGSRPNDRTISTLLAAATGNLPRRAKFNESEDAHSRVGSSVFNQRNEVHLEQRYAFDGGRCFDQRPRFL
jgi:hypothetical protein